MLSERHYKHSFGFFPTNKNEEDEGIAYTKIKERCKDWLRSQELHSGNIRGRFHEIYMFAKTEAQIFFDHAQKKPALNFLFSTFEACHAYITSVIFCIISEDSAVHQNEMRSKKQKTEL